MGTEPTFRRATHGDALLTARAMFERGERVDMQPLADRLGIGRTTLYRWVGDREQLIGAVLTEVADDVFERAWAEARGTGVTWALDVIRRFMSDTAELEPLRIFAEREPQLALRVLLGSRGAVATRLAAGLEDTLRDPRAGLIAEGEDQRELIDTLVQIGTALEWAPIVIGQEPEIDRACGLMAVALAALAR